ncbi:hypothetical protein CXB51_002626 [Gossypium anomalum]|uniref:Uncharacterized protein n=1 Tax=Gossypium anomalum TaxID=47600 RepID=A0A8J5Z5T0_9ROSI|nr:hypothetical protein CXB51_002626 [Gossypium anomalum]
MGSGVEFSLKERKEGAPGSGLRRPHAGHAPTRHPKDHRIPMISALTVVPRPEGRPEIAVLDGHERDGRIDGASVCIDGLDLGSCTDAPRSFQKLLRREGKELGLKTLADNFGFFWPLLFGSSLGLGFGCIWAKVVIVMGQRCKRVKG